MNPRTALIFKHLTQLVIVVLFIIFLTACAEPKVIFKEVKVPVKCDVKERARPAKNSNAVLYLKEILIYTEGLERDLAFCRGENPNSKEKNHGKK